jgi:hypothetical protein
MYQTSVQIFGYDTPISLMEICFIVIVIIIIIIIIVINIHIQYLMFIKHRSLKLCKFRILLFLKLYILHVMHIMKHYFCKVREFQPPVQL